MKLWPKICDYDDDASFVMPTSSNIKSIRLWLDIKLFIDDKKKLQL